MSNYFYRDYHSISSMQGINFKKENICNKSEWPNEWMEITFKSYDRFKSINLPQIDIEPYNIIDLLKQRNSNRNVSGNLDLSLEHLAGILEFSLGIKDKFDKTRRYYPSAGARFPLESYILVNKPCFLNEGIYHYNVKDHSLEELFNGPIHASLQDIFGVEWASDSKCVIVLTSVVKRSTIKYGERGYRFSLIEAGHAMQNICLLSTLFGYNVTTVGGFADNKLSKKLRLIESDEFPIYSAFLL